MTFIYEIDGRNTNFVPEVEKTNGWKHQCCKLPVHFIDKYINAVHRQQNKCYPQRRLLAHFEVVHSILAVANLLAHNNKSQICYCGQISLQSASVFLTI